MPQRSDSDRPRTGFSGVTPLRPRRDPEAPALGRTAMPMPPAPRTPSGEPAARKLIRPALAQHVGGGSRVASAPARRRPAPPERTGAEDALLAKWVARQVPIVVTLEDATELAGIIEWHDRGAILLRAAGSPSRMLLRHAVVSVREQPPTSA